MQGVDNLSQIKMQIKENLSQVKYELLIISGKGGVGKTTVAVNLGYSLAVKKYKVGILDVDIHGPNVPKMLGIEDQKLTASESGRIEPVQVLPNLKVVSLALVGEDPEKPVIWRGPLKTAVIRQFLAESNWQDLDFLIVDSPPGTGDEPLSVCQLICELDGAIVVATPQEVALLDVKKSILFAKELGVPIIGIVENMSFFICPHCQKKIDLLTTQKIEEIIQKTGIQILGRLPFDIDVLRFQDRGRPFVYFNKDSEAAKIMDRITDKIVDFLVKK